MCVCVCVLGGGGVRGWAKLCTCLTGHVLLITSRSFANPRRYQTVMLVIVN